MKRISVWMGDHWRNAVLYPGGWRRVDGLARARETWDNSRVEYSDSIAHNVQRPAVRLYSERRGVGLPEYRRNA